MHQNNLSHKVRPTLKCGTYEQGFNVPAALVAAISWRPSRQRVIAARDLFGRVQVAATSAAGTLGFFRRVVNRVAN